MYKDIENQLIMKYQLPVANYRLIDAREFTFGKHKWGKRAVSKIKGVCLHQQLGEGGFEVIGAWHGNPNNQFGKSWKTPAYSFIINKDGTVYLCNDLKAKTWSQGSGSHAGDENADYIAICFEGKLNAPGVNGRDPTFHQIEAFKELFHFLKTTFGVALEIVCHSDFGKASCPGYALEDLRDTISPKKRSFDTIEAKQQALVDLGYKIKVDGIWGPKSRAAIIMFQQRFQLMVDGIWGPQTESKVRERLRC